MEILMPLLLKEYIEEDCLLGIWEITETYETLLKLVKLTKEEKETLDRFQNEKRKAEWLSVRALIKKMVKNDACIIYNKDNKPFLNDFSYNISISHSRELTAILVSKHKRVGIDLEFMSHPIDRLISKFINDKESITDEPDMRNYHLYIHWCAKEAIYKICDKQDINFRQNIIIEPFKAADKGIIIGIVNNRFGTDTYEINYYKYKNYVIAWCTK